MQIVSLKSLDVLEQHAEMWVRILPLLSKDRVPHSFLFTGPRHMSILSFVDRLMALLLCEHDHQAVVPCGVCSACHLLTHGIHPDIKYVGEEAPAAAIKIDQIRELQQDVYQTPQRGSLRFIVILANKISTSVANALLKMLEEPPAHTRFMLISEQPNALPLTIVSRCQHYVFSSFESVDMPYLSLGQSYHETSSRGALYQQREALQDMLCEMVVGKLSACTVVAKWSTHALEDMLWLLYLITAEAIYMRLLRSTEHPLSNFSRLVSPVCLFNQLRTITALIKKNNQNTAINPTLALEVLLFGYLEGSCV